MGSRDWVDYVPIFLYAVVVCTSLAVEAENQKRIQVRRLRLATPSARRPDLPWRVMLPIVLMPAKDRPGCDPAYPDVCIPPPPPDLDCVDIGYRNFRVLPPDPHGFDRNRDSIGCAEW